MKIRNNIQDHSGNKLYWTKAYVGNIGNDRADEFAKQATAKTNNDITYYRNNNCTLNKKLQIKYTNIWKEKWNSN